ncbi:MAG: hypothetical protein VX583_05955, partial [Bdellovibrionota bacterium]
MTISTWNLAKGLLTSAALSFVAVSANAEPVVFGVINKEIRSISQDADANRISKVNFTDVDGLESRVGVKGNFKGKNSDVDYNIELGTNSNRDVSTDTERIRIRLAYATINLPWGHITLGKAWNPSAIRLIKIDPFLGSSLQNLNLDFSSINTYSNDNSAAKGLGYRARYFHDQISFQTKSYAGFRYHISIDDDNKTAQNTSSDDSEYITQMITHDSKWNDGSNAFAITSSKQRFRESSAKEERFIQVSNKVVFGRHHISLALGTSEDANGEAARSFFAYAFKLDNDKFAFSYGNLSQENTSGTKLGTNNLLALGWFHTYNENLTLRLTAGQYKLKSETADSFNSGFATNQTENKATLV